MLFLQYADNVVTSFCMFCICSLYSSIFVSTYVAKILKFSLNCVTWCLNKSCTIGVVLLLSTFLVSPITSIVVVWLSLLFAIESLFILYGFTSYCGSGGVDKVCLIMWFCVLIFFHWIELLSISHVIMMDCVTFGHSFNRFMYSHKSMMFVWLTTSSNVESSWMLFSHSFHVLYRQAV